jgi:hypothetical protein
LVTRAARAPFLLSLADYACSGRGLASIWMGSAENRPGISNFGSVLLSTVFSIFFKVNSPRSHAYSHDPSRMPRSYTEIPSVSFPVCGASIGESCKFSFVGLRFTHRDREWAAVDVLESQESLRVNSGPFCAVGIRGKNLRSPATRKRRTRSLQRRSLMCAFSAFTASFSGMWAWAGPPPDVLKEAMASRFKALRATTQQALIAFLRTELQLCRFSGHQPV